MDGKKRSIPMKNPFNDKLVEFSPSNPENADLSQPTEKQCNNAMVTGSREVWSDVH
jgi:hypothetical protein